MSEPGAVGGDAVPEALAREFQELGLTTNEAKVLVGLLRLGQANTVQLAKVSGITRTTIYQVLESLALRHLAERLPGSSPAVWATPGRAEVLARLEAGEEAAAAERLAAYRQRTARLSEVLADSFPENEGAALPYVHLIHGAAQVKRTYDRMLDQAESELLMFTRPPYSYTVGEPQPAVMALLERAWPPGRSTRPRSGPIPTPRVSGPRWASTTAPAWPPAWSTTCPSSWWWWTDARPFWPWPTPSSATTASPPPC